jgi:esterase/lipase superfamily enzyme
MRREVHSWYSPHLGKEMELAEYGHWGFALLLFPTAAADHLESEQVHLIDAIKPFIDNGKLKAFAVNSIAGETWLNEHVPPSYRALRQQQYNRYIVEEVVPFIHHATSRETMIVTAGASLGAFQAANTFFRRPDLFRGVVAMSGCYDIKPYADGYNDDNCYFNSPVDYLPNLTDGEVLSHLRSTHHIYILSGRGDYEAPERSVELSQILAAKDIPHHLDLWGHDVPHDWPSWRAMLPHVLGTRF